MKYVDLVLSVENELGSSFKVAKDLAILLDSEVLQITKDKKGDWHGLVEQRLKIFNFLCAIFAKLGIDVPDLEDGLWRRYLPKIWDPAKRAKAFDGAVEEKLRVHKRMKGNNTSSAVQAMALMEVLTLFPECDGYNGINKSAIFAMLNKILVDDLGQEPFRPDYTKMVIPDFESVGPSRPTTVVIIDDNLDDLINTAVALVGIPNFDIVLYHHEFGNSWEKPSGPELVKRLDDVALAVMELKPDIVFMDQSLGDINGSDLVLAIRRLGNSGDVIFVANTGGSPDDLRYVGCLENFDKGRNSRAIRTAVHRVK